MSRPMPTKTAGQYHAELLAVRATAAADLLAMPDSLRGSEGAIDRMRDIDFANRELVRIGVAPTTA